MPEENPIPSEEVTINPEGLSDETKKLLAEHGDDLSQETRKLLNKHGHLLDTKRTYVSDIDMQTSDSQAGVDMTLGPFERLGSTLKQRQGKIPEFEKYRRTNVYAIEDNTGGVGSYGELYDWRSIDNRNNEERARDRSAWDAMNELIGMENSDPDAPGYADALEQFREGPEILTEPTENTKYHGGLFWGMVNHAYSSSGIRTGSNIINEVNRSSFHKKMLSSEHNYYKAAAGNQELYDKGFLKAARMDAVMGTGDNVPAYMETINYYRSNPDVTQEEAEQMIRRNSGTSMDGQGTTLLVVSEDGRKNAISMANTSMKWIPPPPSSAVGGVKRKTLGWAGDLFGTLLGMTPELMMFRGATLSATKYLNRLGKFAAAEIKFTTKSGKVIDRTLKLGDLAAGANAFGVYELLNNLGDRRETLLRSLQENPAGPIDMGSPLDAYLNGVNMGAVFEFGGLIPGVSPHTGQGLAGAAYVKLEGGTWGDALTMFAVPHFMKVPSTVAKTLAAKRIGEYWTPEHIQAFEAAKLEGETILDVINRLAKIEKPSRTDLPTIFSLEDRIKFAEGLRGADVLWQMDVRTNELWKESGGDKTKFRELTEKDPLIEKMRPAFDDYVKELYENTLGERKARANEINEPKRFTSEDSFFENVPPEEMVAKAETLSGIDAKTAYNQRKAEVSVDAEGVELAGIELANAVRKDPVLKALRAEKKLEDARQDKMIHTHHRHVLGLNPDPALRDTSYQCTKCGVDFPKEAAAQRFDLRSFKGYGERDVPMRMQRELSAQEEAQRAAAEVQGFFAKQDQNLDPKIPDGVLSLNDLLRPKHSASMDFAKRMFLDAGALPSDAFNAKIMKNAQIRERIEQMSEELRNLRGGIKKTKGRKWWEGSEVSAEEAELINLALHRQPTKEGLDAAKQLPKEIRVPVRRIRRMVDLLSQEMINSGLIGDSLKAQFQRNKGIYLTRGYEVFDNPTYWPSPETWLHGRRWVKETWLKEVDENGKPIREPLTDSQADTMIGDLLAAAKQEGTMFEFMFQPKEGQKNLGILKKRKDLDERFQNLFGVYKDYNTNIVNSWAKMSTLLANHNFLETVVKAGMNKFIWNKDPAESPNRPVDANYEFKESVFGAWHPLTGKMATEEVVKAFERQYAGNKPEALRYYYKANSWVKKMKTVGSIQTHMRNLTGNVFFATAQGLWTGDMNNMFHLAQHRMGWQQPKKFQRYIQRLTKAGLFGEEVSVNEINDMIGDYAKLGQSNWMQKVMERRQLTRNIYEKGSKVGKKLGKLDKVATDLYRLEDQVWKIFHFEGERARYKKAHPEWTDAQLDAKAVEITHRTTPTYSRTPEWVQAMRQFPLTGNFVTFPYQTIRSGVETIKLIREEWADPKTKGIALQRAVGALATAAMPLAGKYGSRLILDVEPDADNDLRWFMPEWDKNAALIYKKNGNKDQDGVWEYWNGSYTYPWSYIQDPVIAFLNGEDTEKSLKDMAWWTMMPYLDEEILSSALMDWRSNKSSVHGGQIYNEEAPADAEDGWGTALFAVLAKVAQPGTMNNFERMLKGYMNEVEPWGRGYDTGTEFWAMQTGQRVVRMDITRAFGFKTSQFNRQINTVQRRVHEMATRYSPVSNYELRKRYEGMETRRKEIFDDFSGGIQKARRLGVSEDDIQRVMNEKKIPKDLQYDLWIGEYTPWRAGKKYLMDRPKAPEEGGADEQEFDRRALYLDHLYWKHLQELYPNDFRSE